MRTIGAAFLVALLSGASHLSAGAYLFSTDAARDPFIINHTNGYTGTGGTITLGVCLDVGASELASSLDWALKTWNERRAMKGNCEGPDGACVVADAKDCTVANGCTCGQVPFPPDFYPCTPWKINAGSILVHEIGHCAFGLGHNNWVALGRTSFTSTKLATAMNDGTDNIKGSKDDTPDPNPGSSVLHWFRTSDNDPFLIDTTTPMNNVTFSRSRADCPSGTNWPASANVIMAGALDAGRTQSLMVSVAGPNTDYVGLTGDDVNTVSFGFAGVDTDPLDTGDNYTVVLTLEPTCATAALKVLFIDFEPPTSGVVGHCSAELDLLPGSGMNAHFQLVPSSGQTHLLVRLDDLLPPGLSWRYVIMNDGFETGDATWWSAILP